MTEAETRDENREPDTQLTIKRILSQPWIGPSISLVVLLISILALTVATATYNRQGARWAAEDSSMIQLNGTIEPGLTNEGFRIAYAAFYPGREPMRLLKLDIVSPRGTRVALARAHKALGPLTGAIDFDPLTGISAQGAIMVELAIRTEQTPKEDQGSVVEIEGTAVELTGEKRSFVRRAKAIVPPSAVKVPNL